MSNVFHRNPRHAYPVAVRGEGAYLFDRDGRRYLDASGGAAVSCLGHSDRAVTDAIKAQLERLPYVHSSFFITEPMEALAERGGAQDGAPVLRRQGRAAAHAHHRAAAVLPRQHARRARDRRQRLPPQALRAAAHPGDACLAVPRVPRAARRGVGRRVCGAAGGRA